MSRFDRVPVRVCSFEYEQARRTRASVLRVVISRLRTLGETKGAIKGVENQPGPIVSPSFARRSPND